MLWYSNDRLWQHVKQTNSRNEVIAILRETFRNT